MGSRIAFFTAGTVGAGHLVRGLAIERALLRAGSRAEFALFGPPTELRFGDDRMLRHVAVDHGELLDPRRARASLLSRALSEFAPHLLIVDMFWAPLQNILPLPGCEAWLLVRRAPASWLVGPPGYAFERASYSRVLAIEPGLDLLSVDETIDPVLIASPDTRRPQGALRERLGIAVDERLTVVHQAGNPGEWSSLLDACPGAPVHVFSPGGERTLQASTSPRVTLHDGSAFFPLAEWLGDADALVSGAGYNAYWEARWLGYADRTTFRAFPRTIDDQAWRIRAMADHTMRANGADTLARFVLGR